jgi:hypothetical protein
VTHIERIECSELLDVAFHELCETQQEALPFGGLELAPRAIECSACRSHSPINVLGDLARTSPVAGFRVSKVLPDAASSHFPSISMRFGLPSR